VEAIGTARVIADSRIDAQWWATLSAVAPGVIAAPKVLVEHVDGIFDDIGATHQQIMEAQHHADLLCPQRHRAGADALWLRLLLDRLLEVRVAEQAPLWVEADGLVVAPAVVRVVVCSFEGAISGREGECEGVTPSRSLMSALRIGFGLGSRSRRRRQ
jgi:hypothetical protein